MRPKNKFISSSLLVAGGCSCVATMSCNAKEEIVLKNNSFNFRGLEFDNIDELINYLTQLVKYLTIALFNNPGNRNICERLKSARANLYLIQKLPFFLFPHTPHFPLRSADSAGEDDVVNLGKAYEHNPLLWQGLDKHQEMNGDPLEPFFPLLSLLGIPHCQWL